VKNEIQRRIGVGRCGAVAMPKRGVILVAVLVTLMIVSALLLSTLTTTVAGSRALQHNAWRVQAQWLAESALERAAARLQQDADYRGETWRPAAAEFGGSAAAAVQIAVEPAPSEPAQRLVRVVADYPDDPQDRARHTAERTVKTRE
jgi:Tfp pilus assembly protein PilV